MRIGFGKADITPRLGVELTGFGPFLNRRALSIRDRLWSRAMAVEHGGRTVVLVSNDLIGVPRELTARVRALIAEATTLPPEAVMIHCTHTHSGPATAGYHGWGEKDVPYLEVLPARLARAAIEAVANKRQASLLHAVVPCEGIGYNREYDEMPRSLAEVLRDDWRPAHPELTDTTCHVLAARRRDGALLGFASYFGCHPVCCCEETHAIHGDFVGVATDALEREHPGAVGLFLQGAQGDVNACVCHKPEPDSLLALDVIAARYANAVRRGLTEATPVEVARAGYAVREVAFPRKHLSATRLRARLAELDALFAAPGASDASREVRMATVQAQAVRRILGAMEAGRSLEPPAEVQGFRLGPIAFLAAPFEIFQAIKNDVVARSPFPITLVMGITNDSFGYAPDRTTAARGGYAADTVPLILGQLPFRSIHTHLVRALLTLASDLE
jgi:hypothetical protein